MQPVDLAALVAGFVSMLVVGLPGVPEGSRTGSLKVMGAALGCAVLMRLVGPLPAALGALAAQPFARLLTKTPDARERVVDGVKYSVLVATAVGLAFAVRGWLFG